MTDHEYPAPQSQPQPQPESRVSTAERSRVIDRLTWGYAYDYLDEEEFERRVGEAHSALTHGALVTLVSDLPEPPAEATESAEREQTRVETGTAGTRHLRQTETFAAILGGSERKGAWRPARSSRAFALLGGIELDFRDAVMPPGVTEISVFCMLGGLEITVPPELNVELSGIPVLGGFENNAGAGSAAGPTLRINGVAILGGVEVKAKGPRKRKGKRA
jgi:hypothetical protein